MRRKRVTGKAAFGADINLPGMLWAKIVRSPYPHARIKKDQYSKALALPGVKAVNYRPRSASAGEGCDSSTGGGGEH